MELWRQRALLFETIARRLLVRRHCIALAVADPRVPRPEAVNLEIQNSGVNTSLRESASRIDFATKSDS